MIHSLLIIALALQSSASQVACAADSESGDQYEQVINQFLLGRQKLKTGIARYRGKYSYVIESDQRQRNCEINGLYAFDFPEGLLRIDESFRTTEADGTPVTDAVKGFQFAVQEDKTLLRFPEDATPRRVVNMRRDLPEYATKFDLRVLGATHAVGWDRMTLSDLAETFDNQRQYVTEVVRDDKRVRVTWIFQTNDRPGFRRTIWFRVDHDYCPEKIEVCLKKRINADGAAKSNSTEWSEPSQSQQLDVVEFRDQWVPKTLNLVNGTSKRTLEFSWKSLNEPVDSKTFDFDHQVDQND